MSFIKFLKSRTFFIQVAIAVFGLLLIVFALKYWLGIVTNHNQKIQVPDLQKRTITEVEEILNNLDLSYKIIDSASYNPSYPKKSVIEQTPSAGDFVKEKRKIYLTLNPSKYRDVTIVSLDGKTKRQATSQLRAMGLNVGVNPTYVSDIGKDVVRGLRYKNKILNSGDKVPLNSIVELVLGDGNGR
ncbi:PASTA domain-containing protein [Polaribacter tangerinus]|uniref:PASTA domain-containing protein n=1 Tax=Polaribacter tangerinus TaxID=1920034 RepID=UPI000B4C11FF|nr:PASTA domain-containing protein [Polaribacter tangerinus]